MTRPGRALALAALALLAPSVTFADSAKVSDLVDDLQRIQLKVTQGDKAAYASELNQLKTIGAAIAAAGPETWKDKREADSLVIFILSGGPLADLAPLLKGDAVIESERALARGAFAYVTNHESDAIGLLGQTNLTALDARLAGEVAFARSVLETKRDPKAALDLLDWARPACAGRTGRGSGAAARDRPACRSQGCRPRGDADPAVYDPLRRLALCGGLLA